MRDIDSYHCPNCESTHGPLTREYILASSMPPPHMIIDALAVKRRRNYHRHDHYDIADGTVTNTGHCYHTLVYNTVIIH